MKNIKKSIENTVMMFFMNVLNYIYYGNKIIDFLSWILGWFKQIDQKNENSQIILYLKFYTIFNWIEKSIQYFLLSTNSSSYKILKISLIQI